MSREEANWLVKRQIAETEFRGGGENQSGEEFIYEDPSEFPPVVQDFDRIEETEPIVLQEPMRVKCLGIKTETMELWQLKFRSYKFIE